MAGFKQGGINFSGKSTTPSTPLLSGDAVVYLSTDGNLYMLNSLGVATALAVSGASASSLPFVGDSGPGTLLIPTSNWGTAVQTSDGGSPNHTFFTSTNSVSPNIIAVAEDTNYTGYGSLDAMLNNGGIFDPSTNTNLIGLQANNAALTGTNIIAIRYDLKNPAALSSYTIGLSYAGTPNFAYAWVIEGTNDGTFATWTTVDTQTNQNIAGSSSVPNTAPNTYTVSSSTLYRYYRLRFTAADPAPSVAVQVKVNQFRLTSMTVPATVGDVPAPALGDATANKFLKASGLWSVIQTFGPSSSGIVPGPTTIQITGNTFLRADGLWTHEPSFIGDNSPYGKPLIPTLTSNTSSPGWIAGGDSISVGQAWNAFDNNSATSVVSPYDINITPPSPLVANAWSIQYGATGDSVELQGYDGATWHVLLPAVSFQANTFVYQTVSNTTAYQEYRFATLNSISTTYISAQLYDTTQLPMTGLVPSPKTGDVSANKFLFADGTWTPIVLPTNFVGDNGFLGTPIIPAMSANNAPVPYVAGSDTLIAGQSFYAFDGDDTTSVSNLYDVNIDLGTPTLANAWSVKFGGSGVNIVLQASNDNSTWVGIPGTGITFQANTYVEQAFTNTTKYRYWRWANTSSVPTILYSAQLYDTTVSRKNGLVPAPAEGDAGLNKFLKANGNWAVVPNTDTISFFADVPVTDTLTLLLEAPIKYKITKFVYKTNAGSCTVGLNINGTPATFGTQAVSTTKGSISPTSGNVINIGDLLELVISSPSAGAAGLSILVVLTIS